MGSYSGSEDNGEKVKGWGWNGMYRSSLDSIRGFLVYVLMTYGDIIPYLKGIYLTFDSWIPHRYE